MSKPLLAPKTDEELKQIAMDMRAGIIFTDRHCKPDDWKFVFLPLGLGGLNDWTEDEIKEIGMIYEYLDKAGPRSCNGFPGFFSVKMLNRTDTEKVFGYIEKIEKALKDL